MLSATFDALRLPIVSMAVAGICEAGIVAAARSVERVAEREAARVEQLRLGVSEEGVRDLLRTVLRCRRKMASGAGKRL